MSLFIIDPNLTDENGHHLGYDLAIAREALAREQQPFIYTNDRFARRTIEGVEFIPVFRTTSYAAATDDVARRYDDFANRNDLTYDDLRRIRTETFSVGDVVLAPTVSEMQLLGIVSWMKSFDIGTAPLFIVHLMFPSGLDALGKSAEDPLRALFYRLAFKAAQNRGPEIVFFAGSYEYASEYSALAGWRIDVHPSPLSPRRVSPKAPSVDGPPGRAKSALLYAGDLKDEKGALILPELAKTLARAHPEWIFKIHVNPNSAGRAMRSVVTELEDLGREVGNLELRAHRLDEVAYVDFISSSDLAVFTYEPTVYRRKSSGVLWECVSLGVPVVVAEHTWLYDEAKRWKCGVVAYPTLGVDDIGAAFEQAAKGLDALARESSEAAVGYRVANSPKALFDQFGALWAKRIAAVHASLLAGTASVDLENGVGEGWHAAEQVAGRVVRWTKQQPRFSFRWPRNQPWIARVELETVFSHDAVENATVQINDSVVKFTYAVRDRHRGMVVINSSGLEASSSNFQVLIALASTYSPEGDDRELGVLVSGITIRRIGHVPGEICRAPTIETPVRVDEDGSHELCGSISGRAPVTFGQNVLCFSVSGGSPPTVRTMDLFVEGVSVKLSSVLIGPKQWACAAEIPETLVARRGLVLNWDLVTKFLPSDGARIADLQVTETSDDYVWRQIGARAKNWGTVAAALEASRPVILGVASAGQWLSFGKNEPGRLLLQDGWHAPEEGWCWMKDLHGELAFIPGETIVDPTLTLEARAIGSEERPVTATFSLNGDEVGRMTWLDPRPRQVRLRLKKGAIVVGEPTSLAIAVDRQSFAASDSRLLSLCLTKLVLQDRRDAVPIVRAGEAISFGAESVGVKGLGAEWHSAEEGWCWMRELSGEFEFVPDETIDDASLTLEAQALGSEEKPVTATFSLNGDEVGRMTWRDPKLRQVRLRLKKGTITAGEPTTLTIAVDRQSIAPPDARALSLSLTKLVLQDRGDALPIVHAGEAISFGAGSLGAKGLGTEWHSPEKSWCWMRELSGEFEFIPGETIDDASLTLEAQALGSEENPVAATFLLNGDPVGGMIWTDAKPRRVKLSLKKGAIVAGEPASLGIVVNRQSFAPSDSRPLALSLLNVVLRGRSSVWRRLL